MKKILIIAFLLIFNVSCAFAAGFSGQNAKYSVAQALKCSDDSYVTVEGNIIKRLSSDKYLFKDASGTMTVEIDNDKWGNIEVSEKDTVELTGEIERKFNSVQLDVDTVKKIK